MRYYSFFVQVDFDRPRTMAPNSASTEPWKAVGYFQRFLCTERTKEKAEKLALDYIRENELDYKSYSIRVERSVWIRGVINREDIDFFNVCLWMHFQAGRVNECIGPRKLKFVQSVL